MYTAAEMLLSSHIKMPIQRTLDFFNLNSLRNALDKDEEVVRSDEVVRQKEYPPIPELTSLLSTYNIKITSTSVLLLLTLKKQHHRYWIENLYNDLVTIIDHYSEENKRINNLRKIVINIDPTDNDRELLEERLQYFSIRHSKKSMFNNNVQKIKIYLY